MAVFVNILSKNFCRNIRSVLSEEIAQGLVGIEAQILAAYSKKRRKRWMLCYSHCECCVILTMCTNYNVVIKSSTNQKFVSNVNSTVLLYIQVCDGRQVKEREEGGKKGRHQTVPKQPKLSKWSVWTINRPLIYKLAHKSASLRELPFLLDFLDLHIIADGFGQIRYGIFGGGISGTLQSIHDSICIS